jgi:hypothetical protein
MSFISYAEINSLEEFPMIAGTDWVLTFTAHEDDGQTLADIGGATVYWTLSPYGNTDYNILELNGVITGQYTFEITIPAASTETFSGKYLQQITIDSFFGQRFRPAQGVILILQRTPLN